MRRLKLASLLLISLLGGCFTPAKLYQAPTHIDGQYSKITVTNQSANYELRVTLFEDPIHCMNRIFIKDKGGPLEPGETFDIYAKRDEPFSVMTMFYHGVSTSCFLGLTLTPKRDEYRIVYDVNSDDKVCSYHAFGGATGATQPVPTGELVIRYWNMAALPSGPWCKPMQG